jgi:hypothetical protein
MGYVAGRCLGRIASYGRLSSFLKTQGAVISLKLFGFIPESVFTFIPDHCSESSPD